jgi:DNA-binding response OmpR family regulator
MTDEPKKVVIIDDEEDIVTYLTALLDDNGYAVESAMEVGEGLELVKATRPDLICLDILMPGETGISLYKRIRAVKGLEKMPVLFISGMSYTEDMAKGEGGEAGELPPLEHYIEKPIEPGRFLETVRALIG